MTVDELKKYYADLLIIQYVGKAKAYATIQMIVEQAVIDLLPTAVRDAFDLENATGVQLDIIGKYIGLSREGYDFTSFISLNDNDYRQALKIKIIQNNYGSTLYDIQRFLKLFFDGQIYVFDYLGMRLGYFIESTLSNQLVEFFVKNNLLPKPMAVQLSSTIYGPNVNQFFGFRTYTHEATNASPFNTYDDYHMDYPWLSYDDALVT